MNNLFGHVRGVVSVVDNYDPEKWSTIEIVLREILGMVLLVGIGIGCLV